MGKKVSKSRTFAVLLTSGASLGCYFLCKKTERDESGSSTFLDVSVKELTQFSTPQKDDIIDLLVEAGLTVRFYDPEEKQWMDRSKVYGLVVAPGNRDGTWTVPVSVESFEEDYLKAL